MRSDIYWINDVSAARLALLPHPRGGDWLENEIISLHRAGVDHLVSLLTDTEVTELDLELEKRFCEAYEISFHRFPIDDRTVPQDAEEAARFILALGELALAGRCVAIHCRMGIGRSSLIVASILVTLDISVDDAFEAISSARGFPVPDTLEQKEWVEDFSRHRDDHSEQ